MLIHPLSETYRGFRLGFTDCDDGYHPCWKSSLEKRWIKSDTHVMRKEHVLAYAKDCIDFQYRTEAAEFELGRRLTQDEMAKLMEA